MPQTQFANNISPFAPPQKKAPRAKSSPPRPIDVSALVICDDPLPGGRTPIAERKYDARFAKLKPGQCLKCEPSDASRIATSLKGWIKRQGLKDHIVRAVSRYETDGMGRVWLLYVGPKGSEPGAAA